MLRCGNHGRLWPSQRRYRFWSPCVFTFITSWWAKEAPSEATQYWWAHTDLFLALSHDLIAYQFTVWNSNVLGLFRSWWALWNPVLPLYSLRCCLVVKFSRVWIWLVWVRGKELDRSQKPSRLWRCWYVDQVSQEITCMHENTGNFLSSSRY